MNRVFLKLSPAVAEAKPSDQELLHQYLSTRSENAFAELMRRHEKPVQRACRQVLRNAVDVDDAFQATFLVLLRRAKEVRWQPSLRGWLIAVAHRLAVRLAQQQQRLALQSNPEAVPSTASPPEGEVSWREACAALHEELDQLRQVHRLPLLLCYLQGYSRDEAAQFLGCSVGSVKANLERGRQALKARLERRGITLSAGLLTILAQPGSGEAGVPSVAKVLQGSASPRVQELVMQGGLHSTHSMLPYALVACVLLALGLGIAWLPRAESAPHSAEASTASIAPLDAQEVRYTGTVIDQQGTPVEGARLFASYKLGQPPMVTKQVGVSRSNGDFECTVKTGHTMLWAYKPGMGLDVVELHSMNADQPLTLHMKAEQLVQGVFKNEAGLPVANARVGVVYVCLRESGQFEEYLEKVRQGQWNAPYVHPEKFALFEMDSPLTVQSDAEGKFTIRGLPLGAIINITYIHPQYATNSRQLSLLAGFSDTGTSRFKLTADQMNQAYAKAHPQREVEYGAEVIPIYSGPTVSITLRAGAVLAGTVTDSSGMPLAGVGVSLSGGNHQHCYTGPDGTYSLTGVAKAPTYMIRTAGFDRFLPGIASAVHRDAGPVRLDLRLRRGTLLKGKVIDGKTGQGVKCHVQVRPTPANPIMNKPDVEHQVTTATDDAGNFQLVAHVGDVLVVASPYAISQGQSSPYVPAKILPTHSRLLQKSNGNESRVTFHGQGQPYDLGYAYQLLDLPSEGETSIELTLTRGIERKLTILDPDGKPVTSVLVAGLDRQISIVTVKDGTAAITGLSREEGPRYLFLINKQRTFGLCTPVTTDSPAPLTIQLKPLAGLIVTLQDRNKKPVVGLPATLQFSVSTILGQQQRPVSQAWSQGRLSDFNATATSDAAGKLVFHDILPGLPFSLSFPSQGEVRYGMELVKEYNLTSGMKEDEKPLVIRQLSERPSPLNRRETRK